MIRFGTDSFWFLFSIVLVPVLANCVFSAVFSGFGFDFLFALHLCSRTPSHIEVTLLHRA